MGNLNVEIYKIKNENERLHRDIIYYKADRF